jgi:hypothetical protein
VEKVIHNEKLEIGARVLLRTGEEFGRAIIDGEIVEIAPGGGYVLIKSTDDGACRIQKEWYSVKAILDFLEM